MRDRGWHALRFTPDPAKVRRDCAACARPLFLPPSKAALYKTCGGSCSRALRQAASKARTRNCETCAQSFTPRAAQTAVGHGRFCSQQCNTAGRRALLAPDVKARSQTSYMRSLSAGLIQHLTGPAHPNWTGGIEASIERQRPTRLKSLRAYRAANPHKMREWAQHRNARKTGRLPRGTVKELMTLQRECCAVCRDLLNSKYHLDHIVPLKLGGEHERMNVQLLCPACNVRKSARDPIVFMQSRGFLL